jgi:hypothetical protein
VQVRNKIGQCLTTSSDGQSVTLTNCQGDVPSQGWFLKDGLLRSASNPNKCIDILGSMADGTAITLKNCDTTSQTQKFTYNSISQGFQNVQNPLFCIDGANAAALQIKHCNNTAAQQFTYPSLLTSVGLVTPPPPAGPPSTAVDPVTGCVSNWKYNNTDTLISGCGVPDADTKAWCMKPAYKVGGPSWAWKYTDDPNDPECLRNWTLYNALGVLQQSNVPSITTFGDTKNWCPVNRYVSGNGTNYYKYC